MDIQDDPGARLPHDETYRRDIKAIRNLQESRHSLARRVFHGRNGELRHAYQEGMEDQLGALGLVLNCITLWNTVYLDAIIAQLRADGDHIDDEDLRRLSPFKWRHINFYATTPSDSPTPLTTRRSLRNPNTRPDQP